MEKIYSCAVKNYPGDIPAWVQKKGSCRFMRSLRKVKTEKVRTKVGKGTGKVWVWTVQTMQEPGAKVKSSTWNVKSTPKNIKSTTWI